MTDNYEKIVQNNLDKLYETLSSNLEKKPSGEYCSKKILELIKQ
jgi:hypothetical protein